METTTIKKFMSFTDKEKEEFLISKIVYLNDMSYSKDIISYNDDRICKFLDSNNEEVDNQELLQQYGSHELHGFLQKNSLFTRIKNIIKKLFT